MTFDPIKIEIYKHLFASIADEMGTLLRKSSFSPNIKERRDYSCAIFNHNYDMIAQAAHIPVHLGAMPLSVRESMKKFININPGDIIISNDPFHGGTHLPDITLVSPIFFPALCRGIHYNEPVAFVASRAHHSDVGGITPGSMPLAHELFQEGLIIPPVKLVCNGELNTDLLDLILSNVRTPEERHGDLMAQIAANKRGVERMVELFAHYGLDEILSAMAQLLSYSEKMTRQLIRSLPKGSFCFSDVLDDDGFISTAIPIAVKVTIDGDRAIVDFSHSAPQQLGSVNAVHAITLSAVLYVFRCLLGLDVPNNSGCIFPIEIINPPGSILNALRPAAVAGGNVETSQRIVDVLLGALAQACPEKIPAASQGTMNNISIGGYLGEKNHNQDFPSGYPFTYYETIGGGAGARPNADGLSAIHTHMTNTQNTPIEALEYSYPLQIQQYSIRRDSGGLGAFRGGDGIIREIKILTDCQVTLLTERRKYPPYGLAGGEPGMCGLNVLIRDGNEQPIPSKGVFDFKKGDILRICTPGGGGYGHNNS